MPLIALIPKHQTEMTYGTMERVLKMADMWFGAKVDATIKIKWPVHREDTLYASINISFYTYNENNIITKLAK